MSKFYLKCCSLSILMLLCISTIFAQQSVTGIVTDASGPVKGVSISIKGTNKATQSDSQGAYAIQVETGQTLRFSMIGYATQEIIASSAKTINVFLVNQEGSLDEVVVTAMGIKREKKTLGYSFQDVKGDQLVDAKETNIANALVGKVSGLQIIKGSAGPASSTKITLRGNNSLTGDNQPLIIVDGVPMNNFLGGIKGNGDKNNDIWNPATDMGGGLGDINPDDIESMSVLKGGAASALYGSRAGNGAIIITTKSGKAQSGAGITYSSTLGLETIFMTPELQNNFGQGKDGVYNPTMTNSWGENISGKAYDNIGSYFNTGVNHTQNLAFQQQLGETNIYSSATYLNDQSKIPGSSLERLNLMTKVTSSFGPDKRWTTDVKVQYMNINAKNRPVSGHNDSNVYSTLFTMPRSINILDFKNPLNAVGDMAWYGTSENKTINPYWLEKYRLNNDIRDRFIMNGNIKYKFNDWLDTEARFGRDQYTTNYETKTYGGSPLITGGSYVLGKNTFFENNFTLAINARKDDLFGKWGGAASIFGQIMKTKSAGIDANTGELQVPNLFYINNSKSFPTIEQSLLRKQINSLYATAEINYDNYIFLNVTGRNDWSSALGLNNRSFFYPSVSGSWVISDMITKTGGILPQWLSFAKLRGSYAEVGNDLPAFQLYNVYDIGKDPNGNTTAGMGKTKFNPDVLSELIRTVEFGFDTRLFNSRLGLDFAWYKTNATNQLIDLPMNPYSGYEYEKINAGNIQNSGFEVVLDGRILTNADKLTWNSSVNFSTNKNKIISLIEGADMYPLGSYDNVSIRALEGGLYGDIYGTKFLRVEDADSEFNGQLILNGNGVPQAADDLHKLGNQAPKALVGWNNSFAYKSFGLSFLVDGRFGGEFFSGTNLNLQANGNAAITAPNGERAPFVVDGVVKSNGSYAKNTQQTTPQLYWAQVTSTSGNYGITEQNVYDATNIRLRNVTLSYNFPKNILGSSIVQRAKVSFTANNVWMIKSYANGIDPESVFAINSNATGFENFSTPTSRSFFLNLTLGF
ncbi:SusC/RagA family TonB-linked outer membrane protein [Sphingobacterium faecale]|uniref:SusC/RagA family TonB-linked outer membrane protein n=1 Tax=Sphingobacterium faecale TaxID=2803775 RepID=A0ABS1R0D9_9SPHI|nr:SusC/RagA family TonB-linked outer membrane protein [Sphingobacterium faecale]MBL1407724.1 SusC/RagA family TonB-linked outer membrane protein [Sphingobacterium faecale]